MVTIVNSDVVSLLCFFYQNLSISLLNVGAFTQHTYVKVEL